MHRLSIGCLLLLLGACGEQAPAVPPAGGTADTGASVRFSPDVLAALSRRTLEGWRASGARATGRSAQVTYTREEPTAQGLELSVLVRIGVCPDDLALCYSTDPEDPDNQAWPTQARRAMAQQGAQDAIASAQSAELQGGRRALAMYRAGQARNADGTRRGTTLALDVRYQDGRNGVQLIVGVSGEMQASTSAELSAYLTQPDALAAARAVFAVFADRF